MASAMDPNTDIIARAIFTSTLSQMDAQDAQLFNTFVKAERMLQKFDADAIEQQKSFVSSFPIPMEAWKSEGWKTFQSEATERREEFIQDFARTTESTLSQSVPGFEDSKENLARIGLLESVPTKLPSPPRVQLIHSDRGYRLDDQLKNAFEQHGEFQTRLIREISEKSVLLPAGPLVEIHIDRGIELHVRLTSLGRKLATAREID